MLEFPVIYAQKSVSERTIPTGIWKRRAGGLLFQVTRGIVVTPLDAQARDTPYDRVLQNIAWKEILRAGTAQTADANGRTHAA